MVAGTSADEVTLVGVTLVATLRASSLRWTCDCYWSPLMTKRCQTKTPVNGVPSLRRSYAAMEEGPNQHVWSLCPSDYRQTDRNYRRTGEKGMNSTEIHAQEAMIDEDVEKRGALEVAEQEDHHQRKSERVVY